MHVDTHSVLVPFAISEFLLLSDQSKARNQLTWKISDSDRMKLLKWTSELGIAGLQYTCAQGGFEILKGVAMNHLAAILNIHYLYLASVVNDLISYLQLGISFYRDLQVY